MYDKRVCRWSVAHIWSYWICVDHLERLFYGVVSSWTFGNCVELFFTAHLGITSLRSECNCCLTGITLFIFLNTLHNTNQTNVHGGNARYIYRQTWYIVSRTVWLTQADRLGCDVKAAKIRQHAYPAGGFWVLTAEQAPVWWKWPGTAPL